VLVLRSGETDRKMAEVQLKLLGHLPVRIVGVVLNDVQTDGEYRYYAYLYSDLMEEERPLPRLKSKLPNGGAFPTHVEQPITPPIPVADLHITEGGEQLGAQ
jgi:Mrp family chromosome partitioning ATPase